MIDARSKIVNLLVYICLLLMLKYVDVSAKYMIYDHNECNQCIDGGGTACQTRRNASESMCCRESEYGAANCTSYP